MKRLVIAAAIALMYRQPAEALLLWNWSYSGTGVSASGTFKTNDAPDGAGFYQIVGITGDDNGVTITGLQPTGTAIPGNEPYAVDNLVSAAEPRLTTHGFGFSLANGDYANPFYNGRAITSICRCHPTQTAQAPKGRYRSRPPSCPSVAHPCASRRPHQPRLYLPRRTNLDRNHLR